MHCIYRSHGAFAALNGLMKPHWSLDKARVEAYRNLCKQYCVDKARVETYRNLCNRTVEASGFAISYIMCQGI
jgi:hypothetical protein